MNTPLKYKLVDKHGDMIARFRHGYDAAHMGEYYQGCKIYNMQWGSNGRIVAKSPAKLGDDGLSVQIDTNEARIIKELREEAKAWIDDHIEVRHVG